jgi:replicative DNA helicase
MNHNMNDSERTIIGHLIRFPESAFEIAEGLLPEDFSSPKLGAIFRAAQDHSEKYDTLLLSNTLKRWGWDVSVFDLVSFEEYAFEGVDLERIKAEIKVEAQKRSLTHYLKSTLQQLEKPGSELIEIHDGLLKRILDLQAGISTDSILKQPSDFREEILNPRYSKAMLTGLQGFDQLTGGLRPNELTNVTGETATGKTTFTTAFIPFTLSQKGHPVLIASFEMKPASIQKKMVQMAMGLPFKDLSRAEQEQGLDLIESLPIHYVDTYGQISLRELKANIFRAHQKFRIELTVLDHLHFFLKYSGDQERQAIDQALRDLKSWAMELGIHIMLVVHPTKLTYDNQIVHLNDLKGSSGLKQIPDNVLSIWRSRGEDNLKNPKNEIILHVLKVRDDAGDEGKVILTFDKRSQRYEDSRPGEISPVEGKANPEFPSPRSRSFSGKELSGGYAQ